MILEFPRMYSHVVSAKLKRKENIHAVSSSTFGEHLYFQIEGLRLVEISNVSLFAKYTAIYEISISFINYSIFQPILCLYSA